YWGYAGPGRNGLRKRSQFFALPLRKQPASVRSTGRRSSAILALRLGALGERESRTARLEEAVVALPASLEGFTPERAPAEWVDRLGYQGLALMNLAERTRDAVMAQTALQQIEAAVEVLRADGDVRAAIFEPRLSDARRIRDALTHAGRNYRPKLP